MALALGIETTCQDCGETLGAVEEDNRRLGISPGGVAEELIDRVGKAFGSLPERAPRDEDVAPLNANKDVALPVVLSVSPALPCEVSVENHEDVVPKELLGEPGEGLRCWLY